MESMQRAAKEKSFILWIVASVALFCVPSFASSIDVEHGKNRVEIFLLEAQNGTGQQAFDTANRVENYDSLRGVASESSVAPNTGAVLVDAGNAIRKVRFSDGIRHAIKKHVSGNGSISLKTLDPGGNIDKWTAHIAKTATSGGGNVRTVATGEVMEIIAPMAREGGGTLNIGVRLFRATGDDVWQLTTILTRQ